MSRTSTDSHTDDDDIPIPSSKESQAAYVHERVARKKLEEQTKSQALQIEELKSTKKEHESKIYESDKRVYEMELMQQQILVKIDALATEVSKYNVRLSDGSATFSQHEAQMKELFNIVKQLQKDKEERDKAKQLILQKLLMWLIPFIILSALFTAANIMGYTVTTKNQSQPTMQQQQQHPKLQKGNSL